MASRKITISAGAGTPAVHTGPRGGRYYVTHSGEKVYGEPPKAMLKAGKIKVLGYDDPNDMPKDDHPAAAKPTSGKVGNKGASASKLSDKVRRDLSGASSRKATPQAAPGLQASENYLANSPGLSASQKALVSAAVKEGGYEKLLKKHPVVFSFKALDPYPGNPALSQTGGDCIMLGGAPEIRINTLAPTRLHSWALRPEGEPFHGGVVSPKPVAGANPTSNRARSALVHELGHHLHGYLMHEAAGAMQFLGKRLPKPGGENLMAIYQMRDGFHKRCAKHKELFLRMFNRAEEGFGLDMDLVSTYAGYDHKEWFAETHAAYVFDKEGMKRLRPKDYALMREARIAAGMDP